MLTLSIFSSNLNENDFELEDEDVDLNEGRDPGHLVPDINCLVNDFPELFGFPKKIVNERIAPQPINHDIDPFVVFLNSILDEKVEDEDYIINVKDINVFYQIEEDEFTNLREILNDCAKIPKKFSLNIIELNYLYCAIVWKNGFELYTQELGDNQLYKDAFFKIIEKTVQMIFDYKVYMKDIVINKYTMKYWQNFYSNLLEYNDINVNYSNYDKLTVIKIKSKNYFFNEDKYLDLNIFFRFYKNYESILRALNKSFFYFYIEGDYLMGSIKKMCDSFQDIIVKEVYGSVFYLLMRNDISFVKDFNQNLVLSNNLINDLQEDFDIMSDTMREQLEEIINAEKNFNLADVLGDEDRVLPVLKGSQHPLLNTNLSKYTIKRKEKPKNMSPAESADFLQRVKDKYDKINAKKPYFDAFLRKTKILGGSFATLDERGRKLEEITEQPERKLKLETKKKKLKITDGFKGHQSVYVTLDDIEHAGSKKNRKLTKKTKRKLFELPVQPDISDPSKFFERMDFIKKPLDITVRRVTLTEFFQKYEERVRDYYGTFANINLIKICKEHMQTKIEAFSNIFCLILQRESSILLQQKYNNSKVRGFINKYFKFITFNFFTYFKVIEDKGDLIEIEALTLFFNEKFFSAIKLAIVSFNNLLMHFEEEYRDFYIEKIQDMFMPLLNKFKQTLTNVFLEYKDKMEAKDLLKVKFKEQDMRFTFLPMFRKSLETKVIKPSFDSMNLKTVESQYSNYINSMNLLSYDKIKQNFIYFSKQTGIKKSSDNPSNACMTLHIDDIIESHKKMKDEASATKETDPEDDECIKDWRLYDEVFHYVFFNTKSKKIIIKKKTDIDSPVQRNVIQAAIENELIKVVNGFIPIRMKMKFDNFDGTNRSSLETCGVLQENSRTKCFSIFGNNNCVKIPNTLYFTRKCPKGYRREGIACVFNCEPYGFRDVGEFCLKNEDDASIPCPEGTLKQGMFKCFKPMKRYFIWVMNPFNNKL